MICLLLLSFYFSLKSSFRNPSVTNSWDPDQGKSFVGPYLDPNCLQRLSADDMSRQRVKKDTFVSNDKISNIIWALSRQNPSSGFLTKQVSNQSPHLQKLARKLYLHL